MPIAILSQPTTNGRLPTKPTAVVATAVSGGSGQTGLADITWTAPTNTGRGAGTYVVRSYDSSDNPGPTASVSTSSTSLQVSGLTIGTDYTFKVELQSSYGLTSAQSNSSTSSANFPNSTDPSPIRAFARPAISTSSKTNGTVVAVSSMSHGGKADTWGRTTGSTTASATGGRSLTFSKVSGEGTQTLSQSGNDLNITGMSEDRSYVFRATWTNARSSGVRITTSVNPRGRATVVSLSWGYAGTYTTYNATAVSSGLTTVDIGNGSSDVTTEWVIEDSPGDNKVNTESLYFRITANNYSDTAITTDNTHTSVATSTYTSDTPSLKTQKYYSLAYTSTAIWSRSTYKDSYHQAPVISNIALIGGGGSGGRDGSGYYAGGGGGGKISYPAGFTAAGDLHIYVGAGGAAPGSSNANGANGGNSSIYNYATGATQVSATGGGLGYAGGDFWGYGGYSGKGRDNNSYDGGAPFYSNPSYAVEYCNGGGGGGESGAGGAASQSASGNGGAGTGAGGGGGAGAGTTRVTSQQTYVTYNNVTASGGSAGGGSSVTGGNSGSGAANTGGGGAGSTLQGTNSSPSSYGSGNGGSGYVAFTFYGK